MRAWLLHIGEDLPVDGQGRKFRYGCLAEALQSQGHDVLYWAPTFRHATKTHRYSSDRRVEINRSYSIQFVHAPGYRRSTSIARLRTYRVLARRFHELAPNETTPDVIVSAIPSLEWANAAVDFGRARDIPVVVDVRDRWPDVFPSSFPHGTQSVGRLLLGPFRRMACRACRNADALTAISQTFLNWALRNAGRERARHDRVVPIGYEPATSPPQVVSQRIAELVARGIDPRLPVCFFAGSFGQHHEVETIVEAARILNASGQGKIQFVLCGDGAKMTAIQSRAKGLPNVHLLGQVDAATLQAVATIAVFGLCAYAKGSILSVGNKPFEYMAGRLAIVSSLSGDLAQLLEQYDCGVTYGAGDANSLASCLVNQLGHPGRLENMRDNGYRAWSQNFRSRDVYARFVDHLTTLASRTAKAA